MMKGPAHHLMRILEQRLHADPRRVVLRPFHLGWQATSAPQARAMSLVADVAALTEAQVAHEYCIVLHDFQNRHWQTEHIFEARYKEVEAGLNLASHAFSDQRRKLIGAYFCHEYTYAAAALMNPSIVPHPDQSGMHEGSVRFILSLRAVGEGHISSIAFREGIANIDGTFELWPETAFATSVQRRDEATGDGPDATVVVERDPESSLANTVIFPITEQQANGLEDLRLVRFDHGGGDIEWIGTYTAYSGHSIRSELLRNKGMALFPCKIGGQYVMIGRQDGKNMYLLRSDRLDCWDDDGTLLMGPKYPWEFIQIGNCGSPVLTEQGWLVITHGVGAMRKYALGAALLDRDDPSRVIARTPEPILTAEDADRAGYVPNVVYTCGALLLGKETLLIPYGISDIAVGFATTQVSDLISLMR